jgi:hypothetical protein
MKKLPLAVSALVTAISAFNLLTSVPFPFVQAWWHAADYDSRDRFSKRHRMADWLVMTDALIGLRRDGVLAKLGPPPLTDRFTDYDLVYHLGDERGLVSIDAELAGDPPFTIWSRRRG